MEKYKIEKDSVQETLIIPLYGRRLCSQRFPDLYQDSTAAMLMEKVDYDFSPLERQANGLMQTFGALEVAMRQNDLAWEVRDYGDVEEFAQELRDMGYQEVRLVDTAEEVFGSRRRAAMMMLGSSRLLVGRK